MDFFNNTTYHRHSHLLDLLHSFSLTQDVPVPTHVAPPNGGCSLIVTDLFWILESSGKYSCETISNLGGSDHTGIDYVQQGRFQESEPSYLYNKMECTTLQ